MNSDKEAKKRNAKIKQLLERGARDGFITYGDVNDAFSSAALSPQALDKFVAAAKKAEIDIREPEQQNVSESASGLSNERGTQSNAHQGRAADNSYVYFSQLSGLPLLTREGEVELGKRIEQTENALRDLILESGVVLYELINLDPRIRTGDIRFIDLRYGSYGVTEEQEKKIVHRIVNNASALEAKRLRLINSFYTDGRSIEGKKSLTRQIERLRSEVQRELSVLRISSGFWRETVFRLNKAANQIAVSRERAEVGSAAGDLAHGSVSVESNRALDRTDRFTHRVARRSGTRFRTGHSVRSARSERILVEKYTGIKASDLSANARRISEGYRKAERAKAEMVEANLRIVVTFAMKFVEKPIPLADLIQEGNLGLIRAVEKFDYRRGHRFSTYAIWWIRHAMKRAIIDHAQPIHLPVRTNEQLWKIARVTNQFVNKRGREPTANELSKELGVSLRKIKDTLDTPNTMLSLDSPLKNNFDRPLSEFVVDASVEPEDDKIIRKERAAYTNKILKVLSKRELYVIRKRYGIGRGGDHTLREIGKDLGVSRERIRQIEAEAIEKLRNRSNRLGVESVRSENCA